MGKSVRKKTSKWTDDVMQDVVRAIKKIFLIRRAAEAFNVTFSYLQERL
jgi:hypothetical protein